MRTLLGMVCLLVGFAGLGCGKSEPTPASKPVAAQPSEESTAVVTADAEPPSPLPKLRILPASQDSEAADDKDTPVAEEEGEELTEEDVAELMANAKKNPKDAELLLTLAALFNAKAFDSETGKEDFSLYQKSADCLRQALAINPDVIKLKEFQGIAPAAFLNEARTLSRDKQDAAALKSMRAAMEYGWPSLQFINENPELENVRKSKEFPAFMKYARETRRATVTQDVQALFAQKLRFKFDFDLKDTDGKRVTKQEFKGKLLMVNIWGTWCGPCRGEIPDLAAAYTKYKSRGVELVGLNMEDEVGKEADTLIKKAQKELGINYRCALANDEVFQQIPGYEGTVPTTLFFDRQGKFRVMLSEALDEIMLEMIIEKLLKESPSETTK